MNPQPESTTPTIARSLPLTRPAHGQATRVQVGRADLVLENRRGSYTLLWSDGRESRRYVLGLADRGHLSVELRAPRLPLACIPRDTLTLVGGARLRGYVTIPLVPTVVWRTRPDTPEVVLELLPEDLHGLWQEERGHSFRVAVNWMTRFPFASGAALCVVPLFLKNKGDQLVCPASIDLQLHDAELTELRGTLVL